MLQIKENIPLSNHCTFRIGGPALYFTQAFNKEDFIEAFHFAQNQKVPVFILGKGSNCLFDDRGFKGLVILNKLDTIENQGSGVYLAGSGASFSLLGTQTARDGFAGLEFASGIPGSVGGAVYMNAGACGAETKDSLSKVVYLFLNGDEKSFNKQELEFGYRTSSFHHMQGTILFATFSLQENPKARVLQKKMIHYRTSTQPYGEPSAGCVFRNPKDTSAGQLIEKLGLKGLSMGSAQVSEKHANFLISRKGGKASDVLALIKTIQQIVKEKTGLELETEIKYIPYDEFSR